MHILLSKNVDKAYAVADVIISRAGAIAISELCYVGKPIILVPSPNVAENHQYKNAQSLVNKNAALLVDDAHANRKLVKTLRELLENESLKASLRRNIKKIAVIDAAERIAKDCVGISKMNLNLYKYIYLIGVGGIGMSALARYFNFKGKHVFGYDKVKSDLCCRLESEGINIHYEDEPSDISEKIKKSQHNEVLIIYTSAISNENKIFLFFQNKGYTILKRANVLGMISNKSLQLQLLELMVNHDVNYAGSYLKKIGKDITAFLGGISRNYNTNLLFSEKGNILIIEADEYDKSFLKFIQILQSSLQLMLTI